MEGIKTVLLLFGAIFGGISAKKDFRNETVKCTFEELSKCYSPIASLGASFSAKYADSKREMNQTCKIGSTDAISCVGTVPGKCNFERTPFRLLEDIGVLITQLCTNNSVEQNHFLNSSYCYNKYTMRRKNCQIKYSSGFKTDAKSLCCSNLRTQDCLKRDLPCPRNSTTFQSNITRTYRSLHDDVCQPYVQYCKGSAVHSAVVLVTLIALVISLIQND